MMIRFNESRMMKNITLVTKQKKNIAKSREKYSLAERQANRIKI